MPAKYLLIQGFFYQHQEWLGTAFKGDEGLTAVIKEGLIPFMYAGSIWHTGHEEAGELVGAMQDDFGHSELHDIVLTETELSFSKHYEKYKILKEIILVDASIRYNFKKGARNTWVGTYEFPPSSQVPRGGTRCVLTELDFSLVKRDIAKALNDAYGQAALDLEEPAELGQRH